jgi:hypothetical protein
VFTGQTHIGSLGFSGGNFTGSLFTGATFGATTGFNAPLATLGNLIVSGLSSGFLQTQGASNATTVSTVPIASGGTNQTTYSTTSGVVYYDGTRFQTATNITVGAVGPTLNVATLNVTSLQTSSLIPATTGLFMNLTASYTVNATGNWTGNIAGTISPNLYTLFAPNPTATWTVLGTSTFVNAPTANGGIRFNATGPYMFTVVLSADNNIKTIALSSNTAGDVHSNLANPGVWLYTYRFGVGTNPSIVVTVPVNVTSTSTYYYIDYETTAQNVNIHQTAYTNTAAEAYTGSYVLIRPV